MKHLGIISLIALATVLGCSKPTPTERTDLEPVMLAPTQPTAPQKQLAEVKPETTDVKPETTDAKPNPEKKPDFIDPLGDLTAETLQQMTPEAAETALLQGFGALSEAENAELQVLKDRANIGDDRAKEAFVLAVLKGPHSHPEYVNAIRFLKTIREFHEPEAMMQRGLLEWQTAMGSPEAIEKAKIYFKQAADANHPKTLEFLLRNGIFGMRAEAFKRLNQIYEQKAINRDPQVLYEWARMLEFAPPEMQKVADALIQEAAQAGYAPAMHTWSVTLMAREGNWAEGYALLQKAAAAGNPNANLQLATLYMIAHYADNLAMAHEMGGYSLTEAQFAELRNTLAATGDPKMHIVQHATQARGFDEACTLLLAIAANADHAPSTMTARDAAIDCIDQFVIQQPTRDACDRAYDQLTYAEHQDLDLAHVFSDAQREQMGRIVLKCYHLALDRDENYPSQQPHVGFATALQLAVLYAGNHAVKIAPNALRQLQYVTYAAAHDDVLGQTMLAQHYADGTGMPHNAARACFWYDKAQKSEVCRQFCTQPGTAEMGTCQACQEAQKAYIQCSKK